MEGNGSESLSYEDSPMKVVKEEEVKVEEAKVEAATGGSPPLKKARMEEVEEEEEEEDEEDEDEEDEEEEEEEEEDVMRFLLKGLLAEEEEVRKFRTAFYDREYDLENAISSGAAPLELRKKLTTLIKNVLDLEGARHMYCRFKNALDAIMPLPYLQTYA